MINKNTDTSPDDKFGPQIADLLGELSDAVNKESGAKSVYITASFVYDSTLRKGRLKLDIKVSPDAKQERARDGVLRKRGDKMQHGVEKSAGNMLNDAEE
jgi:hypothetical protein